jgi:DNA-binding MarR family transcriptional regulator
MDTDRTLDELLARLFITAYKVEERAISEKSNRQLSISELHVLREIGLGAPRTMTQIATGLKISVGALTTAIAKLIEKGLVHRERSTSDKRVVYIRLTEDGAEKYQLHEEFHEGMIAAAVSGLSDEERRVLLISVKAIDEWFSAEWKKVRG